jgi:hypothetical protein
LFPHTVEELVFNKQKAVPSTSKDKFANLPSSVAFETVSSTYAIQLLKAVYAEATDSQERNRGQEISLEANLRHPTSSSKFAKLVGLETVSTRRQLSEIESYLDQPREHDNCDILGYWHGKKNEFPILASLAKKYLAIPATTGSVERLFSIAGSIGRARRANTAPKTFENILLYKEFRENFTYK